MRVFFERRLLRIPILTFDASSRKMAETLIIAMDSYRSPVFSLSTGEFRSDQDNHW